ncbi:DUF5662 family protein [Candidatus Acetatifactor stercoripullorum]|uniref:DUF5662 family protein n=1 Tax=Candidatus Acetatifactor stercoripullorum TaxID=2838414 RepID=UPI00298E977B|nr:DUF5662 family protein [Candidatus Acetatifactor stercoripullorum]
MSKAWKHFKTITYHKYLVAKGCFRVGLYRQGLLHDLSKYSPAEFLVGARYYQGNRSPNNAEREAIGYSSAWLHHKGRNKHHYEYWIDYSTRDVPGGMAPVPMPYQYIVEMIMDRIAASKVYLGGSYTDESPLTYYYGGTDKAPIHEETKRILEEMLIMLAKRGEEETFRYMKEELKRRKNKAGKEGNKTRDMQQRRPVE